MLDSLKGTGASKTWLFRGLLERFGSVLGGGGGGGLVTTMFSLSMPKTPVFTAFLQQDVRRFCSKTHCHKAYANRVSSS